MAALVAAIIQQGSYNLDEVTFPQSNCMFKYWNIMQVNYQPVVLYYQRLFLKTLNNAYTSNQRR